MSSYERRMVVLEKCMITSIVTLILIIPLLLPIWDNQNDQEKLAWVGIIVSAGIGVIITIIVDDRSKKSHQEVVNSQETIQNLLGKLNETDQKHREALDMLKNSRNETEKIAIQILEQNLEYISDIIDKIQNSVNNGGIQAKDTKKLLLKVMPRLESPLNVLTQVIPHIVINLEKSERENITKSVSILRKFIILSTLETKYNEKEIINKLVEENQKIIKLVDKIKNKN